MFFFNIFLPAYPEAERGDAGGTPDTFVKTKR